MWTLFYAATVASNFPSARLICEIVWAVNSLSVISTCVWETKAKISSTALNVRIESLLQSTEHCTETR